MSSKVERERRKAQLLSQIQQQRLDLSASRREWLETTGAYDRRWNMLLSLRSWALVGSHITGKQQQICTNKLWYLFIEILFQRRLHYRRR